MFRIPSPRIPRQVCRVHIWRSWSFFKRDIQPRGKGIAKNAWKYHKLQSSANFFAQRGFMGIFNMSFLVPCRTKWHQQSYDIIFFRVQPLSYQPMSRNSDTAIQRSPIRRGFYYNGVGWVRFCLAESQSGLYPHMLAQFGRDATAVSKKSVFPVYK